MKNHVISVHVSEFESFCFSFGSGSTLNLFLSLMNAYRSMT